MHRLSSSKRYEELNQSMFEDDGEFGQFTRFNIINVSVKNVEKPNVRTKILVKVAKVIKPRGRK